MSKAGTGGSLHQLDTPPDPACRCPENQPNPNPANASHRHANQSPHQPTCYSGSIVYRQTGVRMERDKERYVPVPASRLLATEEKECMHNGNRMASLY